MCQNGNVQSVLEEDMLLRKLTSNLSINCFRAALSPDKNCGATDMTLDIRIDISTSVVV
jgi:hypothetical protein